ncbi:MAG: hypothetical protein C0622_08805 [Desulfuromonas sp.]|nr:MAG: hypothetical protein C0622_08805 [Desulfuromonas sp.]
MKTFVALCLALFVAVPALAVDNPWDVRLPFKEATVTYALSGTMKGERAIYVKDYGRTSAEYTTTSMTMMGFTQQQKEAIITTPDWEYTIDLMTATGTKQVNPQKYFIEEFSRLSSSEQKTVVRNAEALGYSTIEGLDGSIEKGVTNILGYQCDRAQMMGMTVYTISGTDFPLKVEGSTMGVKMSEAATGIDKGAPPAEKFVVPTNIRLSHDPEADRMMQEQARMTIQHLLEGELPSAGMGGGQYQDGGAGANGLTPEQQQQMQQMLQMFNK